MTAAECPLCAKVRSRTDLAEAEVVWQFPTSVAFLGAQQFYKGYCVLVARTHATELSQLDGDELPSYLAEMCLLAQAIETAFAPRKLNYELLGNQVPHLHWHLFARPRDDPEPTRPVWFALDRAEADAALRDRLAGDPAERLAISRLLRQHLEGLQAPTA